MRKEIKIIASSINEMDEVIKVHLSGLSFPMDSWLEDMLLNSKIYKILIESQVIGYGGLVQETLHFFHVVKEYFSLAPAVLDKIVQEKELKNIFIMTQDPFISALIAEWNYEKEMQSCCFTDSHGTSQIKPPLNSLVFEVAKEKDVDRVRKVTGNFFDEESGGFASLEERITAETIFLLEDGGKLLGCGIIEKGHFYPDCVSIGMYTHPEHRNKGVASAILVNLKKWAYSNNLRPVAGCWYYNTLSRKSLESAGMIAASKGYAAVLGSKEKLPLRTGNPPGELVGSEIPSHNEGKQS